MLPAVLAASAAVVGTIVAFTQRRKILAAYEREMETKRAELIHAIEQQMKHAIDLFYKEIAVAFEPLAAFCIAERETLRTAPRAGEKAAGDLR